MDLKAIADAIAGRYSGVTANGESIVVGPTASLPNGIATGPALIVMPPIGELSIGTSARRDDLYTFRVLLLRDPLDVPARTDALYAWFNALHDRVALDWDLGLGSYVSAAECVAMRMAINGETYGLGEFDVVEMEVQVRVNEHVTIGV